MTVEREEEKKSRGHGIEKLLSVKLKSKLLECFHPLLHDNPKKEKFEKMSWLIITTAIPAISGKTLNNFFNSLVSFSCSKTFFIPSFYEILIFLSVSATFHPTLSSLIRERDVKRNFANVVTRSTNAISTISHSHSNCRF